MNIYNYSKIGKSINLILMYLKNKKEKLTPWIKREGNYFKI
jgi:hypothetical protein